MPPSSSLQSSDGQTLLSTHRQQRAEAMVSAVLSTYSHAPPMLVQFTISFVFPYNSLYEAEASDVFLCLDMRWLPSCYTPPSTMKSPSFYLSYLTDPVSAHLSLLSARQYLPTIEAPEAPIAELEITSVSRVLAYPRTTFVLTPFSTTDCPIVKPSSDMAQDIDVEDIVDILGCLIR
ncbi:hypothetical protein PQX77_012977 [Marasmius sp. AFHP31]|nr:hypothetical protein PQX77_012977 [Marasmius sp. AFHP31]